MAPVTTIHILLIDDDRDDRRLITDMLAESKRAQFIVDEAESGDKGLKILNDNRYDVVFLDYKLPDKDGITILKDIVSFRYNVPVTIITNLNDTSIQVKALEAGAVDFLEKGKINTDILERTCLYAIRMHEKTKNGGAPGVGVLMEQLVNLTRDGIKAQTEMTQETREFRRELGTGIEALSGRLDRHGTNCAARHKETQARVTDRDNLSKFKWILDWIAAHPVIAFSLLVFLMALVVMVASLGVLLFEHLSVDQIKALKGASGILMDESSEVFLQWIG